MPKAMEFVNPTFPNVGGVFVTIRKGGAWGEHGGHHAFIGDTILLVEKIADPELFHLHGSAELLARYNGDLQKVPHSWLKYEHDPSARTINGLLDAMRRLYPKDGIQWDHAVTALLMLRCS